MTEVPNWRRSLPRRLAAAPDGMLWVHALRHGKLAKRDPAAAKIVKSTRCPRRRRALRVNVDGAGIVWANEINTDTVVRLNPARKRCGS